MFENIIKFFKKLVKSEEKSTNSKDAAKERLHLVLMQDRANVSADFLELMKQEIIDVIKKYIEVDESSIDVRLTNKTNEDGTTGAPALYANIPIANIKNEMKKDIEINKNVEKNISEEKDKKVEVKEPDKEIKEESKDKEDTPEDEKKQDEEKKENEGIEEKEIKEEPKTEEDKETENETSEEEKIEETNNEQEE